MCCRAEGIEETFIVVAQFAKCTPGFKSLSLPDQITLIKGTQIVATQIIQFYYNRLHPSIGLL